MEVLSSVGHILISAAVKGCARMLERAYVHLKRKAAFFF